MVKRLLVVVMFSVLLLGTVTACETTRTERGVLIGAGTGAVIGGVIGHNTRLGRLQGAAIGAVVGGVAGYAIARSTDPERTASRETAASRTGDYHYDQEVRQVTYKLDRVSLDKRTVREGDVLRVTHDVTLLAPRSGDRMDYGVFYRFNPEDATPYGMIRRPMNRGMPQGTWQQTDELEIRSLPSGNYVLEVILVDEEFITRDSRVISIEVR